MFITRMQTGKLCNLDPVETGLHNRKRLVDGSAPACEFLCLKCLHLKSKNFLKYYIHKFGLKKKIPSQQLNFPAVTGFGLLGCVTPPRPLLFTCLDFGTSFLPLSNFYDSYLANCGALIRCCAWFAFFLS